MTKFPSNKIAEAHGSVYFYGTMEDAKNFLKFVKSKHPEKDWRIFQLSVHW